jgi:hypothetical protein
MLDDPEKISWEIENPHVVISSKYGCHMLSRLIKTAYRMCKL